MNSAPRPSRSPWHRGVKLLASLALAATAVLLLEHWLRLGSI